MTPPPVRGESSSGSGTGIEDPTDITRVSSSERGEPERADTPDGDAASALPASFYARPAERVARDLLGCHLISVLEGGRTSGRIVETEAYTGPGDDASHAAAAIGRTERNDPLFGPPGTAYIHLNYGIHWCLNAVTGAEGHPAGVLIRALEPLEGRDLMRERRGRAELTSGPARLTQALGIGGASLQRHRLDAFPLWIARGERVPEAHVRCGPRIGISRATELELRFCDDRSDWLSRA